MLSSHQIDFFSSTVTARAMLTRTPRSGRVASYSSARNIATVCSSTLVFFECSVTSEVFGRHSCGCCARPSCAPCVTVNLSSYEPNPQRSRSRTSTRSKLADADVRHTKPRRRFKNGPWTKQADPRRKKSLSRLTTLSGKCFAIFGVETQEQSSGGRSTDRCPSSTPRLVGSPRGPQNRS